LLAKVDKVTRDNEVLEGEIEDLKFHVSELIKQMKEQGLEISELEKQLDEGKNKEKFEFRDSNGHYTKEFNLLVANLSMTKVIDVIRTVLVSCTSLNQNRYQMSVSKLLKLLSKCN